MSTVVKQHAARRLEALSDIVFGLAMTFLVSRLPVSKLSESGPTWRELADLLGPQLLALLLSFSIAGIYWFSHHRRLVLTPEPTALEVVINFAFLFVVMLFPTTTDLYGRYGNSGSMVSIYCTHLTVLSLLHLLLWTLTIRARQPSGERLSWRLAAGPAFGSVVFVSVAMIALRRPAICQVLLFLGFLGPFVTRLAGATAGRGLQR